MSVPSVDTSQYELEPGTILDAENEGDAEILRKRASGTSDLTNDLIHLHSGEGDLEHLHQEEKDLSQPRCAEPTSGTATKQVGNIEVDVQNQQGKHLVTQPPPVVKETIVASGSNIDLENAKSCGKQEDFVREHTKNGRRTNQDDFEESEQDQMDEQHQAWEECIRNCQRHYETSELESSSSTSPPHSYYSGGMAGLDPNHSAEWVPSSINPNMSKSKKRRKRQQKNKEALKKHDSLGKLLSGTQSKSDEDYISTFDLGNQNRGKKKAKLQVQIGESDVLSGNLHPADPKPIRDYNDRNTFTATLNSTKHGHDFDSDEPDELLRGGSDREEEMIQDDYANRQPEEEADDREEMSRAKEFPKDDYKDGSNSSNSTGAKRKRKRNKKLAPKQPKIDAAPTGGSEPTGIATRSKTQRKMQDILENKDDGEIGDGAKDSKGEKEKLPPRGDNPTPRVEDASAATTTGQSTSMVPLQESGSSSQIAVFKEPKVMSRHDIHRIVSKAVQKSKSRISNNFAFNSKIQRFQVVTDSGNIPKFPDINPSDPLKEIEIPEFIWQDQEKTMAGLVEVKSRGVIQFVILARSDQAAREDWDAPRIELVRDFASYLLCKIAELKLEFGTILRWTNPWGNVVVMGLDSSDLSMLQKFRTFFTTLKFAHHYFNTFPKDAMVNSLSLYVLLRSELREFKEEYLAEALFARNQLFGVLETLEAETYTAADTT